MNDAAENLAMDVISKVLGAATPVEYPGAVKTPDDLLAPVEDLVDQQTKDFRKKAQENLEADYELARTGIRDLISDAVELMPNLIALTREAESPRMYDSATNFMKMIAELNGELLEASAKAAGVSGGAGRGKFFPGAAGVAVMPQQGGPTQNNTAVFIGTSEDLFNRFGRRESIDIKD